MKNTTAELEKALGFSGVTFGPLWDKAEYVLECLVRYGKNEGHNFTGKTVQQVSELFAYHDPYAGSGEEHKALTRLLQLGCANRVIA